jgi:hypothetical protein
MVQVFGKEPRGEDLVTSSEEGKPYIPLSKPLIMGTNICIPRPTTWRSGSGWVQPRPSYEPLVLAPNSGHVHTHPLSTMWRANTSRAYPRLPYTSPRTGRCFFLRTSPLFAVRALPSLLFVMHPPSFAVRTSLCHTYPP